MKPLTLLALALALAGCASDVASAAGLGHGCTADDACAAGLRCLDPSATFAASNDAGCQGATLGGFRFCTQPCAADSDCATFGVGAVCWPNGCQTAGFCLRRSDAGASAALLDR